MMRNQNNKEAFNAACRNDFYTFTQKAFNIIDSSQEFIPNWHLELLCDKLAQCAKGKIKRLIINIPPRNLKSHCASICLPAFILGHKPNARIVCVSYSQDLANKFSRNTRKLMESSFYKNIFQTKLSKEKQTESEFETTKNGYRYATSIGSTLTGIGGSYIIIDDPIKAFDATSENIRKTVNDWYNNTLISRLDNKKDGVIILLMQRLHLDDLTGHLRKQDDWEVISLSAIAEKDETFILSNNKTVGRKLGSVLNPELEPIEILENHKKIMNSYNFSAQYQQRPIPLKGNIIDFNDFTLYSSNELPKDGIFFQSWDIALKEGKNNDYSACVTGKYCNNMLYIDNVYRKKLDMNDLINKINNMYNNIGAGVVIIEDSSISTHLLQFIKKGRKIFPIGYKPQGDKVYRANCASFHIKSGKVLLRNDAPWLDDFKAEINAFPYGKHDDQVDALSQLINYVMEHENKYKKTYKYQHKNELLERLYKTFGRENI